MNIHVSNQRVLCFCNVICICFEKSKKCHELPFKGASRGAGKGIAEVYFFILKLNLSQIINSLKMIRQFVESFKHHKSLNP